MAKEMLGGAFRGYLVTDRWSAYNWVDTLHRQLCWAHLIRDFVKISERVGESAMIGNALLEQVQRMFDLWHHVRDGPMSHAEFQAYLQEVAQV